MERLLWATSGRLRVLLGYPPFDLGSWSDYTLIIVISTPLQSGEIRDESMKTKSETKSKVNLASETLNFMGLGRIL